MNALLKALVDGTPAAPSADSPLAERPKPPLEKLSYNHEALVDMLIAEPWISQNELGRRFGMSASWISTVICSDLFQSRLAERREQIIDPELRQSTKAQLQGLHLRSMEILRKKLEAEPELISDNLALQVLKVTGQSLGMGDQGTKVSIHETHLHLEELGQNLVSLLHRKRSQEPINGDFTPSTGARSAESLPSPRSEDSALASAAKA